ncbi:MAG: 16S rRNA (cytosine(1402)-N(4))-methyltransferase RsmH [Rickettsiales bacterium]|jgi:16S rRNA (cytosine1402-N4)-methyltransferase|nr:16S rRNA (cytosine(1402)-N(4))-methyltransferase RsmH [Rickettsiales bacterium]
MTPHIPVMLKEVLDYLQPKDGENILDGTFGAGGYARAILDNCNCNVTGVDRDEQVRCFADEIIRIYGSRFKFYNLKFSEVKSVLKENSLDGIVLDLGVSSMQLDEGSRGFSFNKDALLSMTMGRNNITAFDVVNTYTETEIADIIYRYGEERKSKVIAKKIIQSRPINSTTELAVAVRKCFSDKRGKIDNATKTFQALRIYVNDELFELRTILVDSIGLLKSGGRLIVVSFHSLEDKIVKDFFNENSNSKTKKINKYREESEKTIFKILTKRPVVVSEEESNKNHRARSAKLRGVTKC